MHRRIAAMGCLLLLVSTPTKNALADEVAKSAPAQPPLHAQGFEPSVHVGMGGYWKQLRFEGQPWAAGKLLPSVGIHVDLAYRVVTAFDVGLHIFHQWIDVDGAPPGSTAFATAPGAGLLGRVHPLAVLAPRLPIDVTLGTGFDFSASARQRRETPATGGSGRVVEEHSAVTGFAVPFWLGLDALVGGGVAVGVLGLWSPWFRVEECRGGSSGQTQCQRESTASDRYLFLGVGVRFHLEFVK